MANETLRTATQLYADEFYDDAIPLLKRVLAEDATDLDAWRYLGFALLAVGCVDDAVNAFCKGLELSPQDTGLIYGYGLAMVQAHQSETALQCFYTVLNANPEHNLAKALAVRVLVEQAQALLLQYRYESGRELLEQAIAVDPSAPAPYLQLVHSCLESAHHALAQQWVQRGVESCPESVELIQLAARMGLIKPPIASAPATTVAAPIPDVFLKTAGQNAA